MRTNRIILLLLAAALLLAPVMAQAMIVDDGTTCPSDPTGGGWHNWMYVSGQEANCQHGWIETWRCSNCGKTHTSEYGEKGSHDWHEEGKAPTCTENGYQCLRCSVCGETARYMELPAYGHDPMWVEGYPPTCTENGKTDGQVCGACGMEMEAQKPIPALGHDFRDDWYTTSAATCTQAGEQVRYCHRCQKQETRTLPALGHNWSEWATLGGTTCNEPGMRYRTCSRCGMREEEDLPVQNHDWGPWKLESPGTCMQKEMNVRACTRCGLEEYRYGDFGDHDWGEWQTIIEPTATEQGVEMRFCKLNPDHVEERAIPATGNTTGTTPEGDPNGNPDGTTPEEKAELTVTVLTKDGEPPYGEKTEFKPGEKYWFHTFIENTGNVDVELYDCDKAVNGAAASTGYSIGSRYLLKPGEKVDSWDGYYLAGKTGWISETSIAPGETSIAPGTETETLAGTVTFSATVRGYKPGTDEVICIGEGSATIGLLKDSGLHPSISYESLAAPDAGVGKRYEGAFVLFKDTITNTGDCPVYIPGISHWSHSEHIHDLNAPNGEADWKMMLNPGESLSFLYDYQVDKWEAEFGFIDHQGVTTYYWYNERDELDCDWESSNEQIVDLTYPEGGEPEPPKPELTLTVTQNEPEKEAYTYTDEHVDENYITNNVTVTNTGSVPLNFQLIFYRDDTGFVSHTGFQTGMSLAPGESWNRPAFWYYVMNKYMTPDPEDSLYAGTATCHFEVEGYDVETGETVCVSNSVSFTHRIAKPGPAPWPIPSLSAMTAEVKVSAGYESSDPTGYQLGEKYGTHLITENTGSVAIPAGTIHVYDPYDGWTDTYYGHDFEPGERITGCSACWSWGTVTEEDVARGYIYFPPVEFTWEDPDSGETMHATSNALTLPVISKTGLLVQKSVGNTPANGEYFTAGEMIQWKLTVTNTSGEPIKNITVTDQGEVVGTFAEIAPGDTKECTVGDYEVSEYDEFVGEVTNQAVAKGFDLKDTEHTWFGNIAHAPTSAKGAEEHPLPPTGDPDKGIPGGTPGGTPETPEHPGTPGGGEDPSGPLYGVKVATSIYKTTAHGPANYEYYQLAETVDYTITITNTGETALENVTVTDSLHGLAPIAAVPSIAPGASADVSFSYTVTQDDVDYGSIVNQASIGYTFLGGKPGTPMTSNPVIVYAGDGSHVTDTDKDDGTPKLPGTGEGDFCSFALTALGGSEIRYTLHACAEHTEAAKNAEAASAAEAVGIWKAEIDKLYQALYDAAKAEAQAAVMNDRAAFWAYADAFAAVYGDEALAGLLRLRCAELCCMQKTAPEALPDSILGEYAAIMTSEAYENGGRAFSALDGSDCEVTVKLDKDMARTLALAVEAVRGATRVSVDKAFIQTQAQWQMALDGIVNANYKAADKETRKAIVSWRTLLDQVITARAALLEAMYPGHPETVQEALANLYRDAAIDANAMKK